MEALRQIFDLYKIEIILITMLLALFAIIVVFINFHRTSKILKKYHRLMRGADNKNLEYMLLNHLDRLKKNNLEVDNLDIKVQDVLNQLENCIQEAAIVRFNPFNQMGGDQSFSIALLNARGNGVIITGLYSREGSSVFAKPVIEFQSQYPLSDEEKEAIDKASRGINL